VGLPQQEAPGGNRGIWPGVDAALAVGSVRSLPLAAFQRRQRGLAGNRKPPVETGGSVVPIPGLTPGVSIEHVSTPLGLHGAYAVFAR